MRGSLAFLGAGTVWMRVDAQTSGYHNRSNCYPLMMHGVLGSHTAVLGTMISNAFSTVTAMVS